MSEAASGVRNRESTRRKLVESAVEIFVHKGVAGASVDDLARAAGFTRGAFYSNFSSKEEVFWESFASVTSIAITSLEGAISERFAPHGTQDPNEALVETLHELRSVGVTWYVLHTEALSAALREPQARTKLGEQRTRLLHAIALALASATALSPAAWRIEPGRLAEILLATYLDRLVMEVVTGEQDHAHMSAALRQILESFAPQLLERDASHPEAG